MLQLTCVSVVRLLEGGVLSRNVNTVTHSLPVPDESRLAFLLMGCMLSKKESKLPLWTETVMCRSCELHNSTSIWFALCVF